MFPRAEVLQCVAAELQPALQAHGFGTYRKGASEFCRRSQVKDERLAIDAFQWPSETLWHVTFRLKVRFAALEALRQRVEGPAGVAAKDAVTVSKLIESLYPKDGTRWDWEIAGPGEAKAAASEMINRIEAYALPFFQGLVDEGALLRALEDSHGDWPVPTPLLRAKALLLSCAVVGAHDELARWSVVLAEELKRVQGGSHLGDFQVFLEALRREVSVSPPLSRR